MSLTARNIEKYRGQWTALKKMDIKGAIIYEPGESRHVGRLFLYRTVVRQISGL
jgi:hypothetical protein